MRHSTFTGGAGRPVKLKAVPEMETIFPGLTLEQKTGAFEGSG